MSENLSEKAQLFIAALSNVTRALEVQACYSEAAQIGAADLVRLDWGCLRCGVRLARRGRSQKWALRLQVEVLKETPSASAAMIHVWARGVSDFADRCLAVQAIIDKADGAWTQKELESVREWLTAQGVEREAMARSAGGLFEQLLGNLGSGPGGPKPGGWTPPGEGEA